MITITVIRRSDGAVALRKTGTGRAAVAKLHAEARLLLLASGPGVPALLAVEEVEADHEAPPDDGVGVAIVLERAGVDLRRAVLTTDHDRIAAMASLAETVARLHAVGIVHRRVDPGHVLLASDGTVTLCGFGGSCLISEAPDGAAADDVAAIGQLLHRLFGAAPVVTPVPPHRWARPRPHTGEVASAARTVADHASADDPAARPSAASLARSLRALVERPEQARRREGRGRTVAPRATQTGPHHADPVTGRRVAVIATAAVLGLALCSIGIGQLATGSAAEQAQPPTGTEDDGSPSTGQGGTVDPVATCATFATPATPPVPAGPCTRAAPSPASGVVLDGVAYAVGAEDDDLLVVTPACDGDPVVLVMQPSGSVYGFAGPPGANAVTYGLPLASGPAGSELVTDPAPCPSARVRAPSGETTAVPLDALRTPEATP